MAIYMVESYASNASGAELSASAARAKEATDRMTAEGRRVRYLSSTFLPGDETIFRFFDGSSVEDIREASERAEISFERIVEAVPVSPADEDPRTSSRRPRQGGER